MVKSPFIFVLIIIFSGIFLTSGCLEEADDPLENTAGNPRNTQASTSDYNYSSSIKKDQFSPPENAGYFFGEEDISFLDLADALPEWFDSAEARGITLISFSPFTLEGETLIDSEALKNAGFKPDPQFGYIFPEILEESRKHNMKVIIMLEGIAHIKDNFMPYSDEIKPEKLDPGAVQQLISEIAAEGEKHGVAVAVDEEAFNDEYMNAISKAASKNRIPYLHFFEDLKCRADGFISEDFAYYPLDARYNNDDQKYLRHLLNIGSYYGEIGNLNVMFGAARGCNVPAYALTAGGWGMGARTHQNIALMRAIQFNPEGFMFVVGEGDSGPIFEEEASFVENYDYRKQLLPLLEEFARKPEDTAKPLANLILVETTGGEDLEDFYLNSQLSSMSAITSAMLSAGYDLVVTKTTPYQDADLYYVFSPGIIFEEGTDLPAGLAELTESDVPVFYQVAGALPDAPNWNQVTEKLGIHGQYEVLVNDDDTSFFDPIPESVNYDFPAGSARVKYGGYTFEVYEPSHAGRASTGHYLHYINPGDIVTGEVLLTGKTARDEDGVFDDKTALIIRKGNVYFVNGGYLHHAATAILANIMAGKPVYNTPSYGYFTSGKERSVFFTPYDTEVDLNLPGGNRVTEFDEEGNRITPGVVLENGSLRGKVKRFHLVVVN